MRVLLRPVAFGSSSGRSGRHLLPTQAITKAATVGGAMRSTADDMTGPAVASTRSVANDPISDLRRSPLFPAFEGTVGVRCAAVRVAVIGSTTQFLLSCASD
jgi:hypothetical protein